MRALDAERRLRPDIEARGCDGAAASDAFTVGALLYPFESAAHGCDLVVDKGGLALERGIVFHFHRLFGGIGVQRFREVGLDPSLPAAQFGELSIGRASGWERGVSDG